MYAEVADQPFTIVAVAMDAEIEAARPWVEAAAPDFVTLIDTTHRLSSLYNMVNVPQAVWIDEQGRIVRPLETGGSVDILREFDFETGAFSAAAQARAAHAKATYVDAVADWAVHGSASRFVMTPEQARARVAMASAEVMLAHAKFQLGQHLLQIDRVDEAQTLFAQCRELHPDSWNIYRQTTEKNPLGLAAGEGFWHKVMNLGEKAYYDPIEMDGMPAAPPHTT